MTSPDLSIIIVTYNGWEKVRACLQSVSRASAGLIREVIVVDNASTDGTPDRIRGDFPAAHLIANAANRGFAAANNQGIKVSQGKYVLLLNPDTEVQPETMASVVRFLESCPAAWVAGCMLKYEDGSLQPSVGSFPSILEGLMKSSFVYLLLPTNALVGRKGISLFDYSASAPVDWVMGAFMMIRREVFDAIGLLDEQFFMYSEEVDFCKRIWENGGQVWYTPSGVTTHFWRGRNEVSGRTFVWLLASQILFLRKYHRGFGRAVMIMLKYVALVARVLVYGGLGCLTFNRTLLAKSSLTFTAICRLLSTPVSALWGAE